MADRKPFLLRVDRDLHAALEHWAADELRSLNAQIEFLLRRALRDSGRERRPTAAGNTPREPPGNGSEKP